jgi:mRNA interferase RelE/StbE
MYQIHILDAASRELARLDKPIARRIVSRIRWLADNVENIQPDALTGNLAGFFKLRVGDYHIVYEILGPEQSIIIHLIGHRREIYRKR